MKNLKRQDKNGVRHVSDIERKYKLGQIDYTAEEIEKLKMEIVVDSELSTTSLRPVQNKVVTEALNNKVNKEEGKELSSNDFTDELLDKLNRSQENAIQTISVNGVPQTITDKNVDIKISTVVATASEYSYYTITTENITIIPITFSQYSEGDVVEVYINGIRLIKDLHYSISGNNIVLTKELDVVGTEIEIVIKKYN